jgi:class 3 adenylate cyclase/predicted ATPase/tRNA A37 threonylcarbamoyladenosine biosynthesis protein TsaE
MDVGGWLRNLGLEKYEAVFRENEIDETVLPNLTVDDLKDLGIVVIGHRRKLLDAIASLRAERDVKIVAAGAPTIDTAPSDTAERRQVTVMFSDLVGSTALSGRMDPEDLRDVISAYQRCVADTVRRFDGFVAKFLGDGVLVYFGYPQAHEDDAESAVRAGLELIAALGRLKLAAVLQTRIGIATGLVVVGDLIGSGAAQERGIIGETPNLAARLQAIAEPNTVVIADSTRRLVGNLFEFADLGAQTLKGIAAPVRAWSALRANPNASRFEALRAGGTTALVGREEEFDRLLSHWTEAKKGDGQVVLLSGEAGIGKSRLTAALLDGLASEPHTRLRYFCSPQHTNSALHPIIGQMERAAALSHTDTIQIKLDKLDALLARSLTSREHGALFADMLSLPNDGRYPKLELTPQQRRQKTLDALIAQTASLTRFHPVLMVFEDVHWVDPTSLELLGQAVTNIPDQRALLIVTFRPEFGAPWAGRPAVTNLAINRLTRRQAEQMIDRVAGNYAIPYGVRTDIIERTDGIPLFVEEMTKAVIEAGESEAQRTTAAAPLSVLSVPASLHASLMARLDRLGPAKEIAQVGAAIGREFSHTLLGAVARKPEAELEASLDRLIGAGLLFRQGVPPQANYLFKHALVQDAAYGTLLREPRRALHALIAEALESQFAGIAENQPELLARHCAEAGQIEKAAGLWGKAGQRSFARSALAEAAEQFKRALAQIATLPSTPELRREEIKLQVAIITPLLHVIGFSSSETKAAVERARLLIEQAEALGEPPEDPMLLFSVLYGFWVANYAGFNGDAVRELAAQFLAMAEKQNAAVPLVIGHRMMGVALTCTGDLAEGRSHLDRSFSLYDPAVHHAAAMRYGQDAAVSILCFRPLALWSLGHIDTAIGETAEAIKHARGTGQATALMYALVNTSLPMIQCGKYAAAHAYLDEVIPLAEEKGAFFWKAAGIVFRGCAMASAGNPDAVDLLAPGIVAWRSTGATLFAPFYFSKLATAYATAGRFKDAWKSIDDAMNAVTTNKETLFEADVHRTAGEIVLLSDKSAAAKAEEHFNRALAVARSQQSKSQELRAAIRIARLWNDRGERDKARDLLAPIYGWFREGFGTLDLQEAKTLLDALA